MAATDQTYRNQRTLDIVFAVSGVLMLISIVGMFAQDYYREFKKDQRLFREVEEAIADRQALRALPDPALVDRAEAEVEAARKIVQERQADIDKLDRQMKDVLPEKVRREADYQALKADYDSLVSLYNIDVDHYGEDSSQARAKKNQIEVMQAQLGEKQGAVQQVTEQLNGLQAQKAELTRPLTDALVNLKKVNNDFDRAAKNASLKRWTWGDEIRRWPVLDAFASPLRIHQFTLEELPIDYSFKRVTRYDRCMTCHQGIDRAAFNRDILRGIAEVTPDEASKLERARELINRREKVLQGTGESLDYDASDLGVKTLALNDARVTEFCAHPRLDLFVDANSPHPAEKFGCSSCHSGQGSATSFLLSSHTPNTYEQKKRWEKDEGWVSNHYWDYPMLPKRFTESSCLKCHHQVTDLIREGNKVEAPKLVEGYNLIRRAGCFGCHEIAGIKGGRVVGPDLRLEPSPALETLSPLERLKMTSDPLNPPGTMRKVGPSLRRVAEKTYPEWVVQWIRAPRDFRPTTWMPHFYGLTNNSKDALEGTGQEKFPDAEIHAITYYLFQKSQAYLEGKDPYRLANQARRQELLDLQKNNLISEKQQRELEELTFRLEQTRPPVPIAKEIRDESGQVVQLPEPAKDDKSRQEREARGRQLFTERGCLACHSHQGTTTAGLNLPAVVSKADFGPDLSRIALKLGTKPGDTESARRWLVQWILNPTIYHPRTFMPITHLDVQQANDIATWLLSQQVQWNGPEVPAPDEETLKKMARIYLEKATTRAEVDNLLNPQDDRARERAKEWLKNVRPEADERELVGGVTPETLKLYIGRKAISNMGCFGCHDIPGFEAAKPIGTPLNDWGLKDPERLAFEDIKSYIETHYHEVDSLTDAEGQPVGFKDGKAPYDKYFVELLDHHQRSGFLYQKLREPRSYDYGRLRNWDERLRMPQFKFAHTERKEGESDEAYKARAEYEEAQAREKVMTFVLGLVAEPVPAKYVYNPRPERAAEVKGRQVLDKYNCGGCHQIRQGVYEFKKTPTTLGQLEQFYDSARGSFAADNPFPHNNAWVGVQQPRPDRLIAYGVPLPSTDPEMTFVRLTEALRFTDEKGQTKNIPAATTIGLGKDAIPPQDILSQTSPYGGAYAELLAPYLAKVNPVRYGDYKNGRAAGPPPLLREGEKAQPSWLFQFLRNPTAIRPFTVLRMPRFNMSDDEAMALVNYFAAVDKLANPAENLDYPYMAIPQRDEQYWEEKTREYVARLGKEKVEERLKGLQPVWEQLLRDRLTEMERLVKTSEEGIKTAKDDAARKEAEKNRDALRKELDTLKGQLDKKSFDALNQQWLTREAYASDAWRLLANYNTPCLSCHAVGTLPPKEALGPPLDLSWERLRPEWTYRWLANPERLISYPTPMPQNFLADKPPYPEFQGTPRQQAEAVRDVLLNLPRVTNLPANRYHRPSLGEGGTR